MTFRGNHRSCCRVFLSVTKFSCINLLLVGLFVVIFVMIKITCMAFQDVFGIKDSSDRTQFQILLEDVEESDEYVSDDHTFPFLETRDQCQNVGQYDALMVVHSACTHFRRRQEYRETYGNPEYTHPYKLKVVFFIALSLDPTVMTKIQLENSVHGDTVVSNHVDSYHNMTIKAVAVYRWISEKCQDPKVVLKADDDVLFDVHRFFEEFWPPPSYHEFTMYCHLWLNAQVERMGKWRITRTEYKLQAFPAYCSGFFVVVQPEVVDVIYQTARAVRFLWIDDVFIYGLVRQENGILQLVYADHMAHKQEDHEHCLARYGYRCKYWAAVLGEGRQFLPYMLSLQAQRLQAKEDEQIRLALRTGNRSRTSREKAVGSTGSAGRSTVSQ